MRVCVCVCVCVRAFMPAALTHAPRLWPFLHRPGEAGLKRAARASDAASCTVHALLADHLQPAVEQLAFRLGELRGLAMCDTWARVSGLDAQEVEAAERAALRLVIASEQLRLEVVQAAACHRMFCTWMLSVMRR